MKIWIEKEKCNLCKLCVKACVYNAIHWSKEGPEINDQCIFCNLCVEKCPKDAIFMEGNQGKNISLQGDLWVYIEKTPHGISENSLEIISRLNVINKHKKAVICGVYIGSDCTKEDMEVIRKAGASKLYFLKSSEYSEYQPLRFTQILTSFSEKEQPMAFLFPASEKGRDIAPRLATVLKTGLTADCTELSMDDVGLLVQTRPAFSGDLMASIICPYHRPQMATIRSHSFKIEPSAISEKIDLVEIDALDNFEKIHSMDRIISRDPIKLEFDPIEHKKIIISIGRGIESEENVKEIINFARSIDAGIGCSRPIVDKGWLPQSQQVGMSGKAVAPKLYIALGISGSVQHLSGIQSAEYILAINHDESAPIFKVAHMGIVGDIKKLMPELRKWVSAFLEKEN